jgi:hypothetical protein
MNKKFLIGGGVAVVVIAAIVGIGILLKFYEEMLMFHFSISLKINNSARYCSDKV